MPSPTQLPTEFSDRSALIEHVRSVTPWLDGGDASPFVGGRRAERRVWLRSPPVATPKHETISRAM